MSLESELQSYELQDTDADASEVQKADMIGGISVLVAIAAAAAFGKAMRSRTNSANIAESQEIEVLTDFDKKVIKGSIDRLLENLEFAIGRLESDIEKREMAEFIEMFERFKADLNADLSDVEWRAIEREIDNANACLKTYNF